MMKEEEERRGGEGDDKKLDQGDSYPSVRLQRDDSEHQEKAREGGPCLYC